jgi:hypothetical protein
MTKGKSQGQCAFCKTAVDKQAVIRHLQSCNKMPAKDSNLKIYSLILVEGGYDPVYWLYVAVDPKAMLKQLDHFLREIWLECCGHMSAFKIEGEKYSFPSMPELEAKGMTKSIGSLLASGIKFHYEYDFGSTTELALKVIEDQNMSFKKQVQLLARNEAPDIKCDHCNKSAAQICSECVYEEEGFLCKECAVDHKCGEEMLLPVVNSPRTGVCAYEG